MRITKFGHACLLVEEGEARILIDPGALSRGFEGERELDVILITHQHQDHLVPDNIKRLLEHNPAAKVYADEGSAKVLAEAGVTAQTVHEGDTLEVGGVPVEVFGRDHATIFKDIAGISDVGYMIAGRLFYPGDAFTVPAQAVEILAVPASAPWLKVAEAIEYLRSVKPKVAFPVHDAVLSEAGKGFHYNLLAGNGGVELRVIKDGESAEF